MAVTRRTALFTGVAGALPLPAASADADLGLARRLRAHCDRLAHEDGFNGVVLLMKGEKTLFERAYGLRNRSDRLSNSTGTKFNIASVGKMFTSLGIMRLVQSGRLRFEDRLIEAWPDYPDRAVAERITLDQILTHTAGLGNHISFKPKTGFTSASSQTDLVQLFATEGLAGEPGRVAYSNDGYVLLGALIERHTGRDYRDHCRETIFAPLEMADSGFHAPDDIVPNLATPYTRDLARPGVWRAALATDGLPAGAFGGGYSTVGDLGRFGAAIRSNRLLPPSLTALWKRGRVQFRDHQYGYGIQVETLNGRRIYGHTGGHFGVAAEMMLFEGSDHLLVQLSNSEVETYWDIADLARSQIAGDNATSRNYRFTRELTTTIIRRGLDAGIAFAASTPDLLPREGVIDTYGFRAWHIGDAAGAENLLRFNRQHFPESLSALWSLAEFYRFAKRSKEAVATYRAFLERQPGDAEALAYIARLTK